MHVEVEQSHLAPAVGHTVHTHILVVHRHTLVLLEMQAVEAAVEGEDALAHSLQREVGPQGLAVEVVALPFQLL